MCLHGSLPCTPWTSWLHINFKRFGKQKRKQLLEDRALTELLLSNFVVLATLINSNDGCISFEWPKGCSGWKLNSIKSFITLFDLIKTNFCGCACGLSSVVTSLPIKKPWTFVSSSKALAERLAQFQCKCVSHSPCQGKDTNLSGFYPPKLAKAMLQTLTLEQTVVAPLRALTILRVCLA